MHNETYTIDELINSRLMLSELSYRTLQLWCAAFGGSKYGCPCLNRTRRELESFLTIALAAASEDARCIYPLENVQYHTVVIAPVPSVKPAMRSYPIRVEHNLIQSWIVWSDVFISSIPKAINSWFDSPHDEDFSISLLWSKAK